MNIIEKAKALCTRDMQKTAYFACIIGIIFNATVSPTISILLKRGVETPVIVFYRLFFISLLLLPIVLPKAKYRQAYKNADKGTWIGVIGYSICQCLGPLLWAEAQVAGATAFLITIMGNVSIVFVIGISYFFMGTKTSWRSMGGIVVCLSGVGIVAAVNINQGVGGMVPVIICVIASVVGGSYNVFGGVARKNMDMLPMITFGYAFSCVLTGIIGVVRGCNFNIGWQNLLILLVLGCVCTLISHSAPVYAFKYLSPTSVSVVNLSSPFVVAAIAFFMIGEVPTLQMVIGACVMIMGLFYYTKNQRREAIRIKN